MTIAKDILKGVGKESRFQFDRRLVCFFNTADVSLFIYYSEMFHMVKWVLHMGFLYLGFSGNCDRWACVGLVYVLLERKYFPHFDKLV